MPERSTHSGTADATLNSGSVPRLALRHKEAARALGISPRLLTKLTTEKRIPHLRVNSVLLYPVAQIEQWLADGATSEGRP